MIWILGDDFGFKSFNKFYCEQEDTDHYNKEQFEICGFNNDKGKSYDQNTISRIHNNLVGAIQEKILLPKFIVMVLNNDIISFIFHKNHELKRGSESAYERVLKWLMCQFDRLIKTQKEYLPKKSKKQPLQPMFIWIAPPNHKNFKDNTER